MIIKERKKERMILLKIVKNEKSWIESEAVEQLKKYEELDGMFRIAGLPDLHVGRTPVGAAYMLKDKIYPNLIGSDIGCGIALFDTRIKMKKFSLDNFYKKLNKIRYLEEIDIDTSMYDFPYLEKLGTIGSGNHFAEFQVIEKIYMKEEISNIGITKDNLMLMVHSGSRIYGQEIIENYQKKYNDLPLMIGTAEFEDYMNSHNKAMKFAQINRELIAEKLLKALGKNKPESILDSSHNEIKEKIEDGQKYYIHRKGAAPSNEGLVLIAGTRDTCSYIVKPNKEIKDFCYSISHGAGRKWKRSGAKERMMHLFTKDNILQINQRLIYTEKKVLFEEAKEAYKNIEKVIEDLVSHNMIEVVASLKPLITFKR